MRLTRIWEIIFIVSIVLLQGCSEKIEEAVVREVEVQKDVDTLNVSIHNDVVTLESDAVRWNSSNIMPELFKGINGHQWKINNKVTFNMCGEGRTILVNIGIDTYAEELYTELDRKKEIMQKNWVRDAKVFSLVLHNSCANVKEIKLLDSNATQKNIMHTLKNLKNNANKEDKIIVFYSGLAASNGHSSQFFTVDTKSYYFDKKSIEYNDVVSILNEIKQQAFIIINGYFIGTGC